MKRSPDNTPGTEHVSLMSRREFARLASLAAVATACSSDSGSPTAPSGNGITITGNIMTVPLAQNPSLSKTNGMILVAAARALVVRVSANDFRTLTSVCTHQQCTVSSFNGDVLGCPCHGSQFAPSGAVVRGPATQALRVYPATFNDTTGIITANLA